MHPVEQHVEGLDGLHDGGEDLALVAREDAAAGAEVGEVVVEADRELGEHAEGLVEQRRFQGLCAAVEAEEKGAGPRDRVGRHGAGVGLGVCRCGRESESGETGRRAGKGISVSVDLEKS